MEDSKSHKEKSQTPREVYLAIYFCTFFLLIFSFIAKAKKKNCLKGTRIINKTIYQTPVTHQNDLGICYAHSSVGVYRALYEDIYSSKAHLSPILLAFHSSLEGFKTKGVLGSFFSRKSSLVSKLEQGFFKGGFEDTDDIPFTKKGAIEKFIYSFSKIDSLKASLEKIEEFLMYYDLHTSKVALAGAKNLNFGEKEVFLLSNYLSQNGFIKKKNSNRHSYMKTLYAFFLHEFTEIPNSDVKKVASYKVKEYTLDFRSRNYLLKKLNKHFTKEKKFPIGLNFKIGNLLNDRKNNEVHSVFIYGKTCQKGKLYYLVRNSWGGKTLKERVNQDPDDIPITEETIKGDFWLSEEDLKKTWKNKIGALYILKPKKRKKHETQKLPFLARSLSSKPFPVFKNH